MRARAIALIAAAAVSIGACGDSNDETTKPGADSTVQSTSTTASESPSSSTSSTASGPSSKTVAGLRISTDLTTKPAIPKPTGKPSATLVAKDVVAGTGTAAKTGDQVVVNYVGVLYSNGKQFDASWDNGRPYSFALGQGNVIPGWDQGLEGMKIGGRRVLVIPPDLAYGETGQGSIPPHATLVFVVDMLNATPS